MRHRGATALVALAVLAGCSSVPTSGPIEAGPVLDSGASTQFIRVIAAPPSAGAAPEEVVQGFLEANASLEGDLGIARRYLTADAAASWAPHDRTTVYAASSLAVTRGDEQDATPVGATVTVAVDTTGDLLGDGALVTLDPAKRRRIVLTLERGPQPESDLPAEWRIADPPDELLVSDADLRRAFREQQVFFLAESSQTLVPDTRLLPVVGPTLPTALAENVLAGPAAWLAPGVHPGAAAGAALAFGAVPVHDGIATVELTDHALMAAPEQRRTLAAELTWTLTQLPEVRAVEVLVAGGTYEVPGVTGLMDRSTWQPLAPDHALLGPDGKDRPPGYQLREGRLIRVTDMAETPLPAEVTGSLTGLSVALDEGRASLVDRDRGRIWVFPLDGGSGARHYPLDGGSSGSFAPDGSLWFVSDGVVRRVSDDAAATVPVLGGLVAGIEMIRVARDGVRVAVVAGGRVLVGVIQRGPEGAPQVSALHPIVGDLTQARDVSWRSATELDVLGSPLDTGRQLVRVVVGGTSTQGLRAPSGTTDVASAPAAETLAVAAGGIVFANVGLQWRQQAAGESVAYPG